MLDRHAESATIFLSHRAARLPGLVDHLTTTAARVVSLDRLDLFRGVASQQALIRSDPQALRLVTRLPVLPLISLERETPAPTTLRRVPERPTHVLFGSDAVAIGQNLVLGRDGFPDLPADFPRDAAQIVSLGTGVQLKLKDGMRATIDGAAVSSGATLAKGALLEVAGAQFQLIQTRSAP